MENELKIFKSYKQSVLAGNSSKEKVFKVEKIVTIEGNKFSAELPNNTTLTTTIKRQEDESGKEIYQTDEGCPVAISEKEIVINLYRTHEMFITYYLGDGITTDKISWFSKLFGTN